YLSRARAAGELWRRGGIFSARSGGGDEPPSGAVREASRRAADFRGADDQRAARRKGRATFWRFRARHFTTKGTRTGVAAGAAIGRSAGADPGDPERDQPRAERAAEYRRAVETDWRVVESPAGISDLFYFAVGWQRQNAEAPVFAFGRASHRKARHPVGPRAGGICGAVPAPRGGAGGAGRVGLHQ